MLQKLRQRIMLVSLKIADARTRIRDLDLRISKSGVIADELDRKVGHTLLNDLESKS